MKRALTAIAVGLVAWQAPVCWRRLRCYMRDYHNPVKHPLGGFRCGDCGKPGRDMDALGHDGTLRGMRTYSRDNGGEFVRGARWTAEGRR